MKKMISSLVIVMLVLAICGPAWATDVISNKTSDILTRDGKFLKIYFPAQQVGFAFDLIDEFNSKGWTIVAKGERMPPIPDIELIIGQFIDAPHIMGITYTDWRSGFRRTDSRILGYKDRSPAEAAKMILDEAEKARIIMP